MIDRIMFPITLQRLVASEGIGVINRSLAGARTNVCHEGFSGHILNHLSVDPPVTLQKPENNAFTDCPATTRSLTLAPTKYDSSNSISPDSRAPSNSVI